ncbi:MAG: homocysteine S-methyltransferase family protein [Desulfobacterales bacterium]|nr:homocysteine S-methyltransferase family protein [Desulfobacterales bacterium]MDD4393171.1 homocysteine S-methyltransferase family protein [Desulfobacterales bacterium]
MNKKTAITEHLQHNIFILDGATGTEFQKRGMPTGVCPEMWCIENARVVQAVHSDYLKAGADIIYTSTFGANRIKLGQYGVTDIVEVNRKLAGIARKTAGDERLVGGDIGPTGRFVEPFGDLGFEEAVDIFKEQARGLLEGGVDLFAIETMMDIQEARAALLAVRELTDAFVIVTMTYEKDGRTLNGTDALSALITLQSLGADAVGCNCSTGPLEMIKLIATMKPYATVPLVAKPNAGMPQLINDQTVFGMSPEAFSSYGKSFVAEGVNFLGGCCGTTPEHIRALKQKLAQGRPILPVRQSISAVSSARRTVLLEKNRPVRIVGERINPTGKKKLQKELLAGNMNIVRQMARDQEKRGADLLDVNMGVPGLNETAAMKEAIRLLATASSLPLVIDSSNIETIETALRLYPGRALINSISGEEKKIRELIPVAARYGAMFILLPLADKGVPETAEERIGIIRRVFREAEKYGFTREDVVVDGLVMTVSSDARAPQETLKTVEWCAREFASHTILGLSNVSFGMPERKWINSAFMAMAVSKGLTMAIANPEAEELMHMKAASDVLANHDPDAAAYLARFAGVSKEKGSHRSVENLLTPAEKVSEGILEGNREQIEPVLEEALGMGQTASSLVHDIMIPAITRVGDLYDKKTYFLPQLIASAETMKKGIAFLDPYLKVDNSSESKKARLIIATVEGDIHDIGKNIVALMLRNHGFEVLDLGKNVPTEKIIAEAKRFRPDIIGLSALMTTTMVNMKKVIELAGREGLECRFMVGGAVVTEAYAGSIGAHYARDGVAAIRVAEKLL